MKSSHTLRTRLLALAALLSFLPLSAPAAPSSAALQSALAYSRAHGGFALLVLQHGHPLLERYESPANPASLHKIYSGTKAFWCVAALAAQADGLLSLDEPAAQTLPEWRADPRKCRITLRQLLDFTAGLDPGFHLHSDDLADRDAYALALPAVAPPGGSFIYGPGQIQAFGEVLRRKLARRGETPFQYLARRVLQPAGLQGIPYKKDALGNPLLATGFQLTAREWTRWGLFLLAGARGCLPPGALDQAFQGTPRNSAFGLGFWLNREAPAGREVNVEQALVPKWWQVRWSGVCLCRAAPPDLRVSLGSMGQRLYLIPSLDMVITRLSTDSRFSDAAFLDLLLRDH